MRHRGLLLAVLLLGLCVAAGAVLAGGAGISRPVPPPEAGVFDDPSPPSPFHRVQVGPPGSLRRRDLELWWDSLYAVARNEFGASDSVLMTLNRLGINICDETGINPGGFPLTDINLVYDS